MQRLLLLFAAACGFQHGTLAIDASATGDIDSAPMIDAKLPDEPLGPWSTPMLVIPATSDDDPTLTTDLLEMYFNSGGDIYVTKRGSLSSSWSNPTLVNMLSTNASETTPEITGDGLIMFFASDRQGSTGTDLFISTRGSRNESWGSPQRVDELSSTSPETSSAPTEDLLAIVWNSGNVEDLYASTRATKTALWNSRVALTSLNTNARDLAPMLSQDKLTIYFDSDRDGTEDLFVATRATITDPFSPPVPITELNTTAAETDPWVSADGRRMFFASARSGSLGIYETTR
jgi:hypothetical protein